MSDFHDPDYYARQRIIFNRVTKFFLWFWMVSGFVILLRVGLPLLSLPVAPWETYNWVIFLCGTAIIDGFCQFIILNRELEKFDASVLAKRGLLKIGSNTKTQAGKKEAENPNASVNDFPELVQAVEDNMITIDGTMKVPRSEFVLYCNEKDYFSPRNKRAGWTPIDNLLKDMRSGKPVKASQFSQSYQDLARDGKVPLD